MLRDITIGQYYPITGPVHKLDPRTKLFFVFLYIISLFLVKSYIGFIPALIMLMIILGVSKVPVKYILRGLKPILFLVMFTVILNIFLVPGNVLFKWWIFKITDKGLKNGVFLALRLILLMIGTSMLTLTTTPNELTDGLERALGFLKIIKFPVHEMAMMMSIALRFIPILLEETDKIMKAQQARGADFETGNLFRRAKSMIPIFIPLIISAFRRAFDLALAMEARCYHGGKGRTRMKPLRYHMRDFVSYMIILVYFASIILVRIFL